MAADLNRVTLVGRLTRDPEARQTAGGTSVCNMRLAVTSRVNKNGEWGDQANYFDITIFGRQADSVGQYLSKGRRVGVDGRLSWREWETKDGSKRQAVEVIANDIFFLDNRDQGDSSASRQPDLPSTEPAAPGGSSGTLDDDIPFAASWA